MSSPEGAAPAGLPWRSVRRVEMSWSEHRGGSLVYFYFRERRPGARPADEPVDNLFSELGMLGELAR